MKASQHVEEICKKLKPILGENAEKLWNLYLAEDEKGRRELELDIQILAEKYLKEKSLKNPKILLEPPEAKNSQGSFHLGEVIYSNKKLHSIFLRPEDFTKQIGIFAITGQGKTNLAYHLALQLLKNKMPFMVIDWKRSWRNMLSLSEQHPSLKDVQVFTVGRDVIPFLWNPLRAPPGTDKDLWLSSVAEALEKSHLSGPGVAYYLNKIYPKLFKGYTNDFCPNFYDGLREIEKTRVFERELRWKQTAQRIFHSFTLGSASKAFNSRNPIKLEELLAKPVILELDLELPKPLRVFFSEIILRWIHLYRLSKGEKNSLNHVLFLEEAHNLFTNAGFNREFNSLENIYREIRAFGQGIVSITQHPSLLPIYVLGNCHTQIYLGLQHADDIRTAHKSLFLNYDEESYPSILKVGEAIVKIKNRVEPCLVKTPLVSIKKGGITDDWLKVNTPAYLPEFHDDRHKVQPGFLPEDKYRKQKKGKGPKILGNTHTKLLEDIFHHPLSGITQRYKRLKLNPKYGNKFKNLLIAQGCIQPRKVITKKGLIMLFDITPKGKGILRDLGHKFKNISEGVIHKFWKEKIANYYREKDIDVFVEQYFFNGRPDIILLKENKKIAVEIETGKSDFVRNIKRAKEAGFDQIICVTTSKGVANKILNVLKDRKLLDNQIVVTTVTSYSI
jgi:hypothetical protein